ncbi:XTP/dITP diphosphatase [Bacillus sp. PS06]|uniref:XTP/dITP diphosphatase n=1 Tax=Bacillus sp. PS06 TaxID=2764176 RepID=UPI00177D2258|nr:XTP/dITP diphosphatase [Bacillus sp. PS06]MBD8068887.1 XTP/dITP diphosphatase [Bacillus sp. PS06]
MKEIIVATKNKGKVKDFEELFKRKGFVVKSLLDYPELEDVEETGETFVENAILKSEQISKALNKTVISDDSGLSIDALNGEPGVYSARYAGAHKSDEDNMNKVLEKLGGIPYEQRTARFHCALALTVQNGQTHTVEGTCEGMIHTEKVGDHGFGYDPIFYLPDYSKTMAELTNAEKNKISHRANALKKLQNMIDELF